MSVDGVQTLKIEVQATDFIIYPILKEMPDPQKSQSCCACQWPCGGWLFSLGFSFPHL